MAGSEERLVDGPVYTARFLPLPDENPNFSVVTAIVEPPFVPGEDELWLSTAVSTLSDGQTVTMHHMLSTLSKTAFEIQVESEKESDDTYEDRLEVAYVGLEHVIRVLNDVETGKYTER